MRILPEELAWLAGIVDGEGSVLLYKNGGHYVSKVAVTNSDRAILVKVESLLDKLSILWTENWAGEVNKPCFHITLTRQEEQKALLGHIIPYLVGEKKQKALVVVDWIKNHKRSDGKASNRQKKFIEKTKEGEK